MVIMMSRKGKIAKTSSSRIIFLTSLPIVESEMMTITSQTRQPWTPHHYTKLVVMVLVLSSSLICETSSFAFRVEFLWHMTVQEAVSASSHPLERTGMSAAPCLSKIVIIIIIIIMAASVVGIREDEPPCSSLRLYYHPSSPVSLLK
jgi:hypothetical protein